AGIGTVSMAQLDAVMPALGDYLADCEGQRALAAHQLRSRADMLRCVASISQQSGIMSVATAAIARPHTWRGGPGTVRHCETKACQRRGLHYGIVPSCQAKTPDFAAHHSSMVLALTYFSPAFVPAPQGKKAPEQAPRLGRCRTFLALWVQALTAPANAVDDPLAHGVCRKHFSIDRNHVSRHRSDSEASYLARPGKVLALTYFSPAFVPAPQGKKAPEQAPRLGRCRTFLALWVQALTAPANAVDDPLAHGVMEAGDLQGWAERAAFGGLLAVSTFLAWWRGTLGSGQAMSFANLALAKQNTTDIAVAWLSSLGSAMRECFEKDLSPAVWASPVALGIVAFAQFSLPKVVMCSYATLMFGSVLCQGPVLVISSEVDSMAVLALSQPKDSPITALREAAQPALQGIANGLQPQPAVATAGQSPAVAMTGTTGLDAGNTASQVERQVAVASTSAAAGAGSAVASLVTVEFTSSSGTAVLSEDDQLAITLDDLAYRSLLLGFGFLLQTVGIVSGAVWANEAWGNYWSWDPKETWALITWLVYAGYLHTRLQLGWDTRESAKIGCWPRDDDLLVEVRLQLGWDTRESAKIGSLGVLHWRECLSHVNLMGIGLHSYGFFLK
ncbi:Cytochrome c biogenesis protein CcsA, partial [Symbiodinium microadriaticum]